MKGKLFIAEDQPNFRRGLIKLAGKRSAEWELAGEASNGRDALSAMERCVPDLLLTDIRMPHMDGLELAGEIRSRGWDTRIVMITGFKDFAYAQSALKFGVMDFLTKPCVESDILDVLDRTYVRLIEENRSHRLLEDWKRQHEDSQLRSALMGMPCSEEEVESLLGQMPGGELYFLDIAAYLSPEKQYTAQDIPLLQFAVGNIVKEYLHKWYGGGFRLFPLSSSEWALLTDRGGVEADRPSDWLQSLSDAVYHYLKLDLSCRKQGLCRTAAELRQAYTRYRGGSERETSSERKAVNEALINQKALYEKEKEIVSWLMSGESGRLSKELLERAGRIGDLPPQGARIEALLLAAALLRLVQVQFAEWPMASRTIDWGSVYKCETPEEIAAWLRVYIDEFLHAHNQWLAGKNDNPIKQAIRFIEEHYMGECGLTELASHVHLNPSYFSNLFKKETGESVTGYIQNLRVQKAKLLLKSTDMKIFEVSEAIGFNDSNYFTHIFNKMEGMSPKEYRKRVVGAIR
ncbi:response regulator [Saccharibacillus sp. CPCC 101409]|uniref:response regulator transcription factor n=1 Tax=Saccharibacillus sp. CPCC 101409 TaxID=3058041 RepID=UPI002673B89B|nr:response regulator [Saccharibacillus sp. CPCC 101409]MDO3411842.1 response regulator [Saccharibacillus sp. CPCC 101409]